MSFLKRRISRFCWTIILSASLVPCFANPSHSSNKIVTPLPVNTFTVINLNNAGPGSLRQAILDANSAPGTDVINFNIDFGTQTIYITSPLPTITEPIMIDGTSQPGFSGTPIIELNGLERGFPCLTISAGNSIVQGLAINSFSIEIRLVSGGNNVIRGNYLGTDTKGSTAHVNGDGVQIESSQNIIGGRDTSSRNLISGNARGIYFLGGQFNQVLGNYIGTNVSGTLAVPNGNGIAMFGGSNNIIGGSAPGERNLISGNDQGLNIYQVHFNRVMGNFIGTDASGTAVLPNTGVGISIVGGTNNVIGGSAPGEGNVITANINAGISIGGNDDNGSHRIEGNYIGVSVTGASALGNQAVGITIRSSDNNIVGGVVPGARNVISGNTGDGISTRLGKNNLIQGNFIGTDATGSFAIANRSRGINMLSATNATIGGKTAGARNIISGNGNDGVLIISGSGGSNNNRVQGNYIGTRSDGISPLGNGLNGILLTNLAFDNLIGGTENGAGNVIAFNGGAGVLTNVSDSPGNTFSGNSIFANAGLGIDWYNGSFVMENDPQDFGNNNAQNYPILTTAEVSSASTEIFGSLNSKPNSSFRLEFFSSSACDPSGHGEGQIYLGTTTVSTDQNGNVLFDVTIANVDRIGSFITATATNTSRFTSEFSACVKATEPAPPTLLTEENSNRAFGWDSVTLMRDPFPVHTSHNHSSDGITRVSLFLNNVEPQRVVISNFTAQAEDSNGIHVLPVEYVGLGFNGWTQIVIKLTDELTINGDVKVSISCRGLFSNQALLGIRAP